MATASLQNTTLSLQPPKLSTKPLPSPLNSLSFSASFPSLHLSAAVHHRLRRGGGGGAAGARMAATAAASYAAAMADLAKSNNTLDSTSADIEKIDKLFGNEVVYEFFANPTVSEEKKRELVDELVKGGGLQPHTGNFLNLLIDVKRTELVKEIVKEFEIAYNKLTDTELAVVSSVVKLESQNLAQIAKQVQKLTGAKNVRIKTLIDPSLVAGFTVRYGPSGSKLIDMSVKKQLEEIAAQLDVGDVQLAV